MPVNVARVLDVVDALCPFTLAESWDNVGLQLGDSQAQADGVLLTLDVTEDVIEEAASYGSNVVLTHHPLIFQPLDSVTDSSRAGVLLQKAARAGLAIIAAHTNLDSARDGLADALAQLLGITNSRPIEEAGVGWSKLVTFVPAADLDRVRQALFDAGAGFIGDYKHCSYYIAGTGTFFPMEGAEPSIGEVGRDETVAELRLEMVFPSRSAGGLVEALRQAHSYEEPAYDIYPLETTSHHAGGGRVGELPEGVRLDEFARQVSGKFDVPSVRYSGNGSRVLNSAAVVPGSGAAYIGACAGIADVLVTGDIKYHDQMMAAELGLALIEVSHELSERRALELWEPRLRQELASLGVSLVRSSAPAPACWQDSEPQEAGGKTAKEEGIGIDMGEDESSISAEASGMFQLHVDGGSRGNPGPAAIGAVLMDASGDTIATLSEFIGKATNNVAEYSAMVAGLELALDRDLKRLAIYSDSELMVRQVQGSYKVKNEGLRSYYKHVMELLAKLESYELHSVPRESNAHADELVNQALDEQGH